MVYVEQAMELRKLCNHPFLCDGLEENIVSKHRASNVNRNPKLRKNLNLKRGYDRLSSMHQSNMLNGLTLDY